jgi:hypothetical protein
LAGVRFSLGTRKKKLQTTKDRAENKIKSFILTVPTWEETIAGAGAGDCKGTTTTGLSLWLLVI